jgi:trk system potassium uptake protein TrkH
MQSKINSSQNRSELYELKPGDKKYRVPRRDTWHITLPKISPPRLIKGVSFLSFIYGFAVMIAAGTILLMLPVSSNNGQFTPLITCLFTSGSAVCVTGLVVVDTLDHWSLFGQIVIALLIQLGGLGYMTITTLFLIITGRKIGLRDRILAKESIGISHTGGVVRLTRNIFLFTLIAEIFGALVFFIHFSSIYEWPVSIWKSVFQSISSFNNAGFDLYGGFQSLVGFNHDYLVLLTTAALIIIGGISFVVIFNLYQARSLHRSSVDTKLVLLITFILLIMGTVVIFASEYNDPNTLGSMSMPFKLLNSFFQSVTSRTCGFNAINIGSLGVFALFFTMVLMFIGGSSGSTAGGIKVNSFGLIVVTVWNTVRGKETPQAFGRQLPLEQVFRVLTLFVLSIGLIAVVFLILSITEDFPSINILFETVSAFGTVGLTTGITPGLSTTGQIIIVIVMFIGRLGPLTLITVLTKNQKLSKFRYPKGSVRIG